MSQVLLKFLALVERSVVVQGVLTTMIVAAWLYLMVMGRPVPEALSAALWVVLGFYFGAKATEAAMVRRRE